MRPPVATPVQHTGLSTGQTSVIRKLTKDSQFRTAFFKDSAAALAREPNLSDNDKAVLAKIKTAQIDAIHSILLNPSVAADGTHTLAYAIAFAVVVAILLAMPNPMDVSALGASERN